MKTHPNQRWPDKTKQKTKGISSREIPEANGGPKPFEKDPDAKFTDFEAIHKKRVAVADKMFPIYEKHSTENIDVKKSLELDEKWNKEHAEDFPWSSYGKVKGDPNVDYLGLMKKMKISNVHNWEQWKYDGMTDKEIFDTFYKFHKNEQEYNRIHGKK